MVSSGTRVLQGGVVKKGPPFLPLTKDGGGQTFDLMACP